MAVGGELNADLAAAITAAGAPALGVCAASAGLVRARRRPPVPTSEGRVDYGLVGDVEAVDAEALVTLLDADLVPVVGPPAGDGAGGFLNVNADVLAAEIAVALEARKLVLVTGEQGVLSDPADAASVISALSLEELRALVDQGALQGGMKPKAAAIERSLQGGVARAHVVSGLEEDALLVELYTNHGSGTLVTLEREQEPVCEVAPQAAEAVV
jgi:acetylglutamate kinase